MGHDPDAVAAGQKAPASAWHMSRFRVAGVPKRARRTKALESARQVRGLRVAESPRRGQRGNLPETARPEWRQHLWRTVAAIARLAAWPMAASLTAASLMAFAIDAGAQTEPAIKVTFLGTGTPAPNPRQFGPSVLVEAGDTKLLFDCGRGCGHRLWNLGPQYLRETSHLFLTHMHSDHTVGVADLYMNGWNQGRRENLRVYGPASAEAFMHHLRLAYEEDVVFRADRQGHAVTRESLDYIATEVADGDQLVIGGVTITTFAVDHHVVEPAFGFRVDAGEFSVVISGDTAYSDNLIRHSMDTDVLIHEVMSPALEHFVRTTFSQEVADGIVALHTLAPDVGRVFTQARPRLGVLTHLDNDPARIPELAAQIESTWSGDFVVAEDLMAIEIGETIRVLAPVAPSN